MYGLINDGYGVSKRLRSLGYEALFGGCMVGGPGYAFWTGYNREMVLAAPGHDPMEDAWSVDADRKLTSLEG